PSNRP
ncbi:hypothetical protein D047_4325B, partial [Vibrio parahaemolyticus VPTS-2010_2]